MNEYYTARDLKKLLSFAKTTTLGDCGAIKHNFDHVGYNKYILHDDIKIEDLINKCAAEAKKRKLISNNTRKPSKKDDDKLNTSRKKRKLLISKIGI